METWCTTFQSKHFFILSPLFTLHLLHPKGSGFYKIDPSLPVSQYVRDSKLGILALEIFWEEIVYKIDGKRHSKSTP